MAGSLHTARLRLHPLIDDDGPLYCRLYTDPAVMDHIAAPLSQDAVQRAFALALRQGAAKPPRVRYWVAREHGSRSGCGLLALMHGKDHPDCAEIGILLLAAVQGRGYATEALAALVDHAFSTLGLQRLRTRHRRDNLAVVGLMRTLGFDAVEAQSGLESHWSLLREDWLVGAKGRAAFAKPPAAG